MNGNRTNVLLDQDEGGGKAAYDSSSSLHPAGSNFACYDESTTAGLSLLVDDDDDDDIPDNNEQE